MRELKVKTGYILRFDKNDKLVEAMTEFVKEQKIKSAWISGLGASLVAELGYYNLDKKEYQWHTVAKLSEITSLTGNIAWYDGKPVLHAHVTLTDDKLKAFGGHVKEIVVGGTCEVNLQLISKPLVREHNSSVGLNTLDL